MAELVDALASGASVRKDVEVQVLFRPPMYVFSTRDVIGNECNKKESLNLTHKVRPGSYRISSFK
jgi:hypothetical protein